MQNFTERNYSPLRPRELQKYAPYIIHRDYRRFLRLCREWKKSIQQKRYLSSGLLMVQCKSLHYKIYYNQTAFDYIIDYMYS